MAKMNFLEALQAALTATKVYIDNNHYNETEINTLLDGKSDKGHTHNYAGSSSAGGAATSANKVNSNLTIKLNSGSTEGTNLFTFNGSGAKTIDITPANIGAAKSSHGTHVSLATATPLVASGTGAVGTSSKQAREDHVHPVQTSVSGNAGSANKVNNSLVIKINGGTTEGTNMFTFDGSGAKTINLKASDLGAPTSHNHDDRYFTEAEVTSKISTAESNAKSYADTQIAALVNSAPDAMNTLKELVERQSFTGEPDEKLIVDWYLANDMAEKGIELISQLATRKIKKQQETLNWLHGDLTMYAGNKNMIEVFGIENGCKMNEAIQFWIITTRMGRSFEEDYPTIVEWLKKFVPTVKQPFIFWRAFGDWLEEKGIYFKDQKKGGGK